MPIDYSLDPVSHLVVSTASGVLTEAETVALYARLRSDPDFRSGLHQLCDLRAITGLDISTAFLKALAQFSIFDSTSLRAFVTSDDLTYGLARMLQTYCENEGREVRVFRDMKEAERWLALQIETRRTA